MHSNPLLCGLLGGLLGGLLASLAATAGAQESKANAAEEAALLKNAEAFVEAFHKGDAKALAALFTVEGDYTDQVGKRLKGRDGIEAGFAKVFADHKGMKLRLNVGPIRFLAPGVAIEDGTAELLHPDGTPPSRVRYTNVHVKKDGKWYFDSVRDAPYTAPSNYDKLADLEWAIGSWSDDVAEGPMANVTFRWGDNQNYIVSHSSTSVKNHLLSGGTQWIGWDPTTKIIRSFTFDSHGGFGEGTWMKTGEQWAHKTTYTLRDGKKLTATDLITRVDADTVTWQSKDRTLDGQKLPDIKEVKMKRAK